jgi:hypothetical protein
VLRAKQLNKEFILNTIRLTKNITLLINTGLLALGAGLTCCVTQANEIDDNSSTKDEEIRMTDAETIKMYCSPADNLNIALRQIPCGATDYRPMIHSVLSW